MRLRRVLAVGVGVAGAAIGNRVLATAGGPISPAIEGTQETYRWRGIDVAYTELGDPSDPDLVAFHGISATGSSEEFDLVAPRLAEEYHLIVPDLPGFGRSERPPVEYSPSLYEAFVRDFLADVADRPHVLASSLTGSYAALAAAESPVASLTLVCPTAETMPGRRPWLSSLFRSPAMGTALFNALTTKPALRYFATDHGYYDPESLSAERLDRLWRTAHQPGARYAPAAFLSGELDPEIELGSTLAALELPITLVWGRESTVTPLRDGRELAETVDGRLVVFDYARLLPHVEHPEAFVEEVSTALERT